MKTALLLEKLEGQLATLRQRCAPVSQFATLSARFDRHLFQTRATTLQACLDEAGDNLAALRHAVEQQQLPPCAGKNRKHVSAFNPLAMERVCHWKMPLTMSNWLSI